MCKDCHQNRAMDAYRLSVLSPFLSGEWNYDKNKTTPYDVAANSLQFAWWKCSICWRF